MTCDARDSFVTPIESYLNTSGESSLAVVPYRSCTAAARATSNDRHRSCGNECVPTDKSCLLNSAKAALETTEALEEAKNPANQIHSFIRAKWL